jgi:TonB family protein
MFYFYPMKTIRLYLAGVLCIFATQSYAQQGGTAEEVPPINTTAVEDTTDQVYRYAEEMPRFPGADPNDALTTYLKKNIKYPQVALDSAKQGTVYVEFVVRKDGSISDVKAVRGVKDCPEFSTEAVRVISAMPKWIPGKMQGKPVDVMLVIPVKFSLT